MVAGEGTGASKPDLGGGAVIKRSSPQKWVYAEDGGARRLRKGERRTVHGQEVKIKTGVKEVEGYTVTRS